MKHITIIGCGVVGAAIAYELSLCQGVQVTVIDQTAPAQGSTAAALGVGMAVISHKVKGRNWRLRERSLKRYQTLIPELEALTGRAIQHNTHGILSLCFAAAELPRWRSLQTIRHQQGYELKLWEPERVRDRCPHLSTAGVIVGIYSPQDFQVNPTDLTLALVAGAQANGAEFYFGQPVVGFDGAEVEALPEEDRRCAAVHTSNQSFPADAIVISAGLETLPLTQALHQPIPIGPVLGQALCLHLDKPLEHSDFQPVVNGNDIHLVPLGKGDYWVGATVEFPPEIALEDAMAMQPEADRLDEVLAGAVAYCPALATGNITQRWSGLRPRPQGQAAPVIQPLMGYSNIWLATGHYRNGVLLAPATALAIRDLLEQLG
ncbi:NAD(P)/FAD-dependent oxidoreductase [Phormidium tenue]|uniref:FAD-dependent oxidoreductase n=1 Tax=Phormidium tenue NIES-30 TaxID=549789 RepID=A0A1U7J8K7_9CYAN|nr:FAD-dependent oxidoreductase [Phormidium tenue]MBD2231369.1 FAD-binding oxidoreductase [Phormidium tenue FACHB-1052]OKH49601.1 FAD-dependent oxidoreductase [Phormidium tenue NIES-30]